MKSTHVSVHGIVGLPGNPRGITSTSYFFLRSTLVFQQAEIHLSQAVLYFSPLSFNTATHGVRRHFDQMTMSSVF